MRWIFELTDPGVTCDTRIRKSVCTSGVRAPKGLRRRRRWHALLPQALERTCRMDIIKKILAKIRSECLQPAICEAAAYSSTRESGNHCHPSGVPDLLAYGTGCRCALACPSPKEK